MKKRSLGTRGLEVTSLGYGAMGSTSFYGPADVPDGGFGARYAQAMLPKWV
jgi:aryl-alcohol dehydrogenase-like predicted oxidoreductase